MAHCRPRLVGRYPAFSMVGVFLVLVAMVPQFPATAADPLPTSMVGQGTYYVYATREGLVGGTTSSGHRIVPNDFFVSLPACTPQNCPRGATWGQMTQCGSRCYVRVLNPVTNQCRVEPIKDIGPWFTVDDWWNPSGTRYLNTLSTNPNVLPQGYTAADAARNGLDVGYGRSSTGIGRDNTHQFANRGPRAVGNRAAIDLADGTWRNLRLTSPDTIGSRVFVTLLWQSGGDPAGEAAACGHPLNQRGGSLVTLPTQPANPHPYPPPTATVAVTPGTDGFAVVSGTGGAGLRCRTGPSTGASIITTVAEGARVSIRGIALSGWQPVVCAGQDGWASSSYLRVTYATTSPSPIPTATSTPTSSPGTPTQVPTEPSIGTPSEVPPSPTPTSATPGPTPTTIAPSPTPSVIPSSPTPTTTPPTPGGAVVTGTGGAGLRCRTAPSTAGSRITGLAEGTTVTVRGIALAGWIPVVCGGQEGWVSAAYLRMVVSPSPATPGPSPTPTIPAASPAATPTTVPGAQVGEALVSGTGGVGLRCRSAPSTAGTVITTFAEGTRVQVIGPAIGTWLPVRCAGRDGWSSTSYLRVTRNATRQSAVPTSISPAPVTAGIVANSNGATVRCRALPSLDGTILTSLAPGTSVEVRGSASGDWLPVRCANTDGYVWAEYVEISGSQPPTMLEPNIEQSPDSTSDIAPTTAIATSEPTEVPSPTALPPEVPATTEPTTTPILVTGSGYIASDDGGAVNCRSNPSTDADVITTLEHGLWIETRGAAFDGWQGIRCAGVDGFVAEQYISDSPPPIPTDPPVEPEPEVPDTSDASESIPESAPAGSGPEFGGTLLQPASTWDANGNASVWNAFDGSSSSAWSSAHGASQASITLDLGQPFVLTGVRWMFSQSGGASDLALQVSLDGQTWSHVASSANRAPGTWEGAWTSATARYVRLVFTNTTGAPALGYVAEIQVWGAPAATKGGTNSDQVLLPVVRQLVEMRRDSLDSASRARRNVPPPTKRGM